MTSHRGVNKCLVKIYQILVAGNIDSSPDWSFGERCESLLWKKTSSRSLFRKNGKEQEYFSAICPDCIILLMRRNKFIA